MTVADAYWNGLENVIAGSLLQGGERTAAALLDELVGRSGAGPTSASHQSRRLITRRSQVQILPPLLTRALVTGHFCPQVGGVAAQRSSARPWNVATR